MRLTPSNISIIKRLLVGRGSRPLRALLSKVEPKELITLIPSLSFAELQVLIDALQSMDRVEETLTHLNDAQLEELLARLDQKLVEAIITSSSEDNAAHFLSMMDDESAQAILQRQNPGRARRIELFLSYPEDSTGRLMQLDIFSLPSQLTVAQALDVLRKQAQREFIYYLYCVDREGRLEGVVSMRELATSQPDRVLKDMLSSKIVFVYPHQPASEAADLVSQYGFLAIPVLDESHRLLGLITVDEIVDMMQEQATADLYAQAGLSEDDRVYSTIRSSIKTRAPWMLINLCFAALASAVVAMFEETMSMLIVLASLNNMVALIAGNTAIQTLTVVTRGLAIGDFKTTTIAQAVRKELVVGLALGVLVGVASGLLIWVWKQNSMVAAVICVSMILNSVVATGFGAFVPVLLKRYNLDPAAGSGVIVTFVSDTFSFFSFLGIASLGLWYFG